MSGSVSADVVIEFFDSGAGPRPGPYGVDNSGNGLVPVDPAIVVDGDPAGGLSLPTGSFVTVGFSTATVIDRPGPDIAVSEAEPAGEQAEVYATEDGSNFVLLGVAGTGTTSFDLADAGLSGPIQAVRVLGVDLDGLSPGYDVSGVEALQPAPPVDLGFGGDLAAIAPTYNAETQSLRYGFEVRNLTFAGPSEGAVAAAAAATDVDIFFGSGPSPGSGIFDIDLGTQFSTTEASGPVVEGDSVFYELPIASFSRTLTDEDLESVIVVIVDPDDRVPELELFGNNNEEAIGFPFVRTVPQIQRNIGGEWNVAAEFQDRWLNNPALVIEGSPGDLGADPPKAVQPIEVDFILDEAVDTNGRAREAFAALSDVDTLFTDPSGDSEGSKAVLASRLDERLGDAPVGTTIDFGVEGTSLADLFGVQAQLRPVTTGFFPPVVDPLTGALGNFSFYAIPVGQAEKVAEGAYLFTATGVAIYAADIFEFNGDQPLGYWRAPDDVSAFPILLGGTAVDNSTYNEYRELTGLGQDFPILSDVRTEGLTEDGASIGSYLVLVGDPYTPIG